MKISFVIPSRGRPQRLREMWESAQKTKSDPDVEIDLIIGVDADDPQVDVYIDIFGPTRVLVAQDRISYAARCNQLVWYTDGDLMWMGNDDFLFRTVGWDTKVRTAANKVTDNIFLIFPEDGFKRAIPFATTSFLPRRVVEIMGGVFPYIFYHNCCDPYLSNIFERLGRLIYLPDVLIEHMHVNRGKAQMDDTYARGKDTEQADLDSWTMEYTAPVRDRVAQILGEYMK